jgi:integrase
VHLFMRGGPWRSERMVVRMSQHRAQGLVELRGDLCCTCVDSPPEHELRNVRERNERHRDDNLFHDARKNANLDDVTFHCLRHTFASILIAQGRDVQFVSRQLGHTKTSTTWDTYVHLFEAHRHAHDAREQLEAEYGEMLGAADA